MTTNRPFFGGFLAAFRAQPALQKAANTQTASVASYTQQQHIIAKPKPRAHNIVRAHHHLKSTVAVSWRKQRVSSSNKPLPADTATCTTISPLYVTHSESLPDTWCFTAE
jgi:C4-dicarboxylate-specific signal transduction histidine kinase